MSHDEYATIATCKTVQQKTHNKNENVQYTLLPSGLLDFVAMDMIGVLPRPQIKNHLAIVIKDW